MPVPQRLLAICCLLMGLIWGTLVQAQQGRPALVRVAPVVQKAIAEPITFVGTVEPRRRSLVASELAGIVARVMIEEGQLVQKGKPLVQLRRERLQLALRQQQAMADHAQQQLRELQNGTRPEELREARATMQEAEAELVQARRELQRQLGLQQRGIAAQKAREDAETAAKVAEQRLARAKARYELLLHGPRAERIAQAEALYHAAQAEVARLRYDLRQTQILAPFAGFVVRKHTEVGEWLRQGDPVVELIDLREAHITVPIPERYLSQVQLGATAVVQFDALPGMRWQGKVIRIVPQATASRTFPVTVAIPNTGLCIKSGFFARVTLTIGEITQALLVPKDAIVQQGPRDIVFVIRNSKAIPVPIQRLTFYQDSAVIAGPLKAGEQVVIRGNERLRPGQPVRLMTTPRTGSRQRKPSPPR